MSKYGVLITSAVNAQYSKYSPIERFNQTIKTIDSIKEHVPNAVICMTDCSITALNDDMKKSLVEKVDYFLNFSSDSRVQWIAKNIQNPDIVKNLTELCVVHKFFELAKENKMFDGCDRIFKVSGRYFLTDKFDITKYQTPEVAGKYVVSKKLLSQFLPEVTNKQYLQYMLRIYSFDISLYDDFTARLSQMIAYMQDRVNAGGYIDIEHLFCKFLPADRTVEFPFTGVAGNIAPNGEYIEN